VEPKIILNRLLLLLKIDVYLVIKISDAG